MKRSIGTVLCVEVAFLGLLGALRAYADGGSGASAPTPQQLQAQLSDVESRLQEVEAAKVPVGAIFPFAGKSLPAHFVLADGKLIDEEHDTKGVYAALCAVIRGQFALPHDPAGTCRLPDLRGRAPVGENQVTGDDVPKGENGVPLTQRAVGAVFGSETHALTVAELAPHTHSGTTEAGNAAFYRVVNEQGTATLPNHTNGWSPGLGYSDHTDTNWPMRSHTHNFTTNGGDGVEGQPFTIESPSVVVKYIVRF